MTAVRELIFAAIEARLNQIDGVAEVERMPSADPMSFPAVHIIDGGQQPDDAEPGITMHGLALTLQGYVEQSSGPGAHAAVSQLYADVVAALLTEPPLDGLVETIDEGAMQVEVAPIASERRLVFILDLFITFPTKRGDPAQQP